MNPAGAGGEAAAPATGIGLKLRAERERRGLSIAAVTETLHVDARLIEAMEAGRFQVFDAPVYARGFIRKYAGFLELPADELIAAYDALSGGPATPALVPLATTGGGPARELSRLQMPAIFVLALVFVGGSLWWWISRSPAPAPASTAPAVAAAEATPPPASEAAAAPTVERASPAPLPASFPVAASEIDRATPSAGAPASTPVHVASAAKKAAPVESLSVKGLRECWVEVYGPNGVRLFSDLVQPGDSHALAGPGPWKVFLGNADGVELSMGDRALTVPAAVRAGATARFVVSTSGAVK